MALITIEFDDKRATEFLRRSPAIAATALLGSLRNKIAPRHKAHLQSTELSGGSLAVRTGNTRRAAFFRTHVSGDSAEARIGVDVNKAPGARVLDEGGTVRARGSKLAIPLDAMRTGKGVARASADDVKRNPGQFGYVGSFIRNDTIFGVRSDRTIEPIFALKRQVTIKAVGYLTATVTALEPWTRATLEGDLVKAYERAK